MILTRCAACAAPLAHDAPRCVRCKVRYCDATCQHDHWRRGHKQICKKIHRGGNAEQYNADKKYKEAVAVAVEKCAADMADNIRRHGSPPALLVKNQNELAMCYDHLGRHEDALQVKRKILADNERLVGPDHPTTVILALNLASCLTKSSTLTKEVPSQEELTEAKTLLRGALERSRRSRLVGPNHDLTFKIMGSLAQCLTLGRTAGHPSSSSADLHEAIEILEDATPRARRVLGRGHPGTQQLEFELESARNILKIDADLVAFRKAGIPM